MFWGLYEFILLKYLASNKGYIPFWKAISSPGQEIFFLLKLLRAWTLPLWGWEWGLGPSPQPAAAWDFPPTASKERLLEIPRHCVSCGPELAGGSFSRKSLPGQGSPRLQPRRAWCQEPRTECLTTFVGQNPKRQKCAGVAHLQRMMWSNLMVQKSRLTGVNWPRIIPVMFSNQIGKKPVLKCPHVYPQSTIC